MSEILTVWHLSVTVLS